MNAKEELIKKLQQIKKGVEDIEWLEIFDNLICKDVINDVEYLANCEIIESGYIMFADGSWLEKSDRCHIWEYKCIPFQGLLKKENEWGI